MLQAAIVIPRLLGARKFSSTTSHMYYFCSWMRSLKTATTLFKEEMASWTWYLAFDPFILCKYQINRSNKCLPSLHYMTYVHTDSPQFKQMLMFWKIQCNWELSVFMVHCIHIYKRLQSKYKLHQAARRSAATWLSCCPCYHPQNPCVTFISLCFHSHKGIYGVTYLLHGAESFLKS